MSAPALELVAAHAARARTPATGHELDPDRLGDHLDRLFRIAWALCGSREDAEDLVQDTYARVLARPRRGRRDDDLGYLIHALRNTFVSRRRTGARRPRNAGVSAETLGLADPRAADRPPAAAETHEVFAAIAALPAKRRTRSWQSTSPVSPT